MSEETTQAEKVEQVDVAEQEDVEQSDGRNSRKAVTGVVVSDKMDKSIVVMVEDRVKHPLYGKVMTKSSRLLAHDEENDAGIGDRVRVMETRPLSARKRWRLVSVIERAK